MKFRVIDNKTNLDWWAETNLFKEDWVNNELCYTDIEGFAIEEDGTLVLLDECGKYVYPPEGRFTVLWVMDTNEL